VPEFGGIDSAPNGREVVVDEMPVAKGMFGLIAVEERCRQRVR
jgi:hypothetical protein